MEEEEDGERTCFCRIPYYNRVFRDHEPPLMGKYLNFVRWNTEGKSSPCAPVSNQAIILNSNMKMIIRPPNTKRFPEYMAVTLSKAKGLI